MSDIKTKLEQAGSKVAETAKEVGHRVAEGATQAADWVKEKTGLGGPAEGTNAGPGGVRERMDVIASCGKKVGVAQCIHHTRCGSGA